MCWRKTRISTLKSYMKQDVYKRQLQTSYNCHQTEEEPESPEIDISKISLIRSDPEPVSYTHLDVYKRQMYLWLPLIFDVLIMFILSRMNVEGQFRHFKFYIMELVSLCFMHM